MPLITFAAAAAVATSPIVVTASRTPISEALSGTAISVIDAETIDALRLPLLADYLRLVPSVAVASTGGLGSQTQVRIRGAEGNHTLVFVDGIEANDPASSSEFRFETLLADGIDRIEVLRGPQSALWGSEAIGGVVNVLTRVPPQGRDVYGQIEGGSYGTIRAGVGGGIGSDRAGVTAQATYLTARGYDIAATPGGDKDGYTNLSLSAKAVLRPAPNVELGLVGRFLDADSKFDDFDYTNDVALDAPLATRVRTYAIRGYGTVGLLDDRWTHRAEITFTDAANINRDGGVFQNRSDGSRLKLGYQTSGAITTGAVDHRLTFAVEHERQTFASTDADTAALSNQRRDRAKTAVIAEYRLAVADRFAAGLSVRHDDSNRYPATTTVRATAAGQIGGGISLHASYGEGVADPTFFDLYGFFPTFFVGNPNLLPEHARSVDAGIGWTRGNVKVDVTAYTSELTDEIVPTFDMATFLSGVANATGRSKRRGIEASFEARPADWLRFAASYAYLDASEQKVASGLRLREVRRPRHSGSVTATATAGAIDLAASVALVGARGDTSFPRFVPVPVTLGGYALVTLSGTYRIAPGVALTARVENAADARYQDVFGYRTAGLAAYGGVKVKL